MEQSDLVYTFEEVKKLFDGYNMEKDENGKFLVVKRGTNITYDNTDFIDKVKFAHTWVAATEFGRSRTTSDPQKVTQDDYSNAFDEEAKKIYDFIMENVSQTMLACGRLMRKEPLKVSVLQGGLRAHSEDIVSGLYSNERFLEAFNKWVRACNNMPADSARLTQEVQEKVSTY